VGKELDMETLKYKVIKSKSQYREYCNTLEQLVFTKSKSKEMKDEIELLTFLIEKYDEEHNSFEELDPIELLQALMNDHHLKAKDLVEILDVSKGMVSDILHYKKGLSKDIIRTLASHFKVSQESFNRPYKLKSEFNARLRNSGVMNTPKRLSRAQ
jgi:HTH-type transcriptional regulator/antitoxin HigA